jgi:hypothetical protein
MELLDILEALYLEKMEILLSLDTHQISLGQNEITMMFLPILMY